MRKCSYCNVVKTSEEYASETLSQCMLCSERRRLNRLAKKARVSVTTEDGKPTKYCSDCGNHRPKSDFGGEREYRTCCSCRRRHWDPLRALEATPCWGPPAMMNISNCTQPSPGGPRAAIPLLQNAPSPDPNSTQSNPKPDNDSSLKRVADPHHQTMPAHPVQEARYQARSLLPAGCAPEREALLNAAPVVQMQPRGEAPSTVAIRPSQEPRQAMPYVTCMFSEMEWEAFRMIRCGSDPAAGMPASDPTPTGCDASPQPDGDAS